MRILQRFADTRLRAELAAEKTARRQLIEQYGKLRDAPQELRDTRQYVQHLEQKVSDRGAELVEAREQRDRAIADRDRAVRIAPVIADMAHHARTNPALVQTVLLLARVAVREKRRGDQLAHRYDEARRWALDLEAGRDQEEEAA